MKNIVSLVALRRARHRRNLQGALAAGLLLTILLTAAGWRYNTICNDVCADTLRLHILANSDSSADQALKLEVRDAILGDISAVVAGAKTKQQAVEQVQAALPRLRTVAETAVAARHSNQTVAVKLEQWDFAAMDYGKFALPGGRYTALRVELGAAKGHNWFCVLYPALCVGSTTGSYAQPSENALVFGKYQVRFALLDAARGALRAEQAKADASAQIAPSSRPTARPATGETALEQAKKMLSPRKAPRLNGYLLQNVWR